MIVLGHRQARRDGSSLPACAVRQPAPLPRKTVGSPTPITPSREPGTTSVPWSLFVWFTFLCGLLACQPSYSGEGGTYLRNPVGHDGIVIFEFHDRLWRQDKGATAARRVTEGDMTEMTPALSPDGSRVAYAAGDGIVFEIFVASLATGEVKRLTYDGGSNAKVQGWINDQEVLYSTTIKSKKRGPLLYAINADTSASRPLPLAEASEGCFLGDNFVFVRNERLADAARKYQGGYAQKIYAVRRDLVSSAEPPPVLPDSPVTKILNSYEGISRSPVCLGDKVYFPLGPDRSVQYLVHEGRRQWAGSAHLRE